MHVPLPEQSFGQRFSATTQVPLLQLPDVQSEECKQAPVRRRLASGEKQGTFESSSGPM